MIRKRCKERAAGALVRAGIVPACKHVFACWCWVAGELAPRAVKSCPSRRLPRGLSTCTLAQFGCRVAAARMEGSACGRNCAHPEVSNARLNRERRSHRVAGAVHNALARQNLPTVRCSVALLKQWLARVCRVLKIRSKIVQVTVLEALQSAFTQ